MGWQILAQTRTHTLYYCLIYNFVPLVKPISIHQRKLNSKTIELRMNVQGLPCHHVHLSSCQPPIIQELERVTARERMNSRVEHSWVRNIVCFRLKCFHGRFFRGCKLSTKSAQDCSESSISTFGRWGRQSVYRTAAKPGLHIKVVKNGDVRSTFGRGGRQNVQQTVARATCEGTGALLDNEAGKMCTRL